MRAGAHGPGSQAGVVQCCGLSPLLSQRGPHLSGGNVLAQALRPSAGWAGIVVNGCVRDVAALRRQVAPPPACTHEAYNQGPPFEECMGASRRRCAPAAPAALLPLLLIGWAGIPPGIPCLQHPHRPHGPGQPPHEAGQGPSGAERCPRGGGRRGHPTWVRGRRGWAGGWVRRGWGWVGEIRGCCGMASSPQAAQSCRNAVQRFSRGCTVLLHVGQP